MAKIITNKYGISDAIVKACMIDNHVTMGDISVTQLLDAPQVRMLKRTHDHEEDVSDMIWSIMGTAVHTVIERGEVSNTEARKILEAAEVLMKNDQKKAADFMYDFVKKTYPDATTSDIITEKTLSHTIEGMTFSGTFDRFTISEGLLDDYKNTSVYAAMNPESRKKWDGQLNTYAFLLREHGYTVNKAQITAIFRDYSAGKAFGLSYPKKPIETYPITLQTHKFMTEYLTKRIRLHKNAQLNGVIPDCNNKDRWATSDTFAVKAPGRVKAIKLFDNRDMAEAFILGDGAAYAGVFLERRLGEAKRCDSYCSVSKVCPQNLARLELLNK